MKVETTEQDGVLIIEPRFARTSELLCRNIRERIYNEHGVAEKVIRTIFRPQGKTLEGFTVIRKLQNLLHASTGPFTWSSNNDKDSDQFMSGHRLRSLTLIENRFNSPKFGNGHLVISEIAIFHYKQTTEYNRSGQFTIEWNDPRYGIWWPSQNPILSMRDSGK